MCLHRFYVVPHEAARPGHLQSYQHGSSPTIQEGNMNAEVEANKIHTYNLKKQGLDDGIKSDSDNPMVERK